MIASWRSVRAGPAAPSRAPVGLRPRRPDRADPGPALVRPIVRSMRERRLEIQSARRCPGDRYSLALRPSERGEWRLGGGRCGAKGARGVVCFARSGPSGSAFRSLSPPALEWLSEREASRPFAHSIPETVRQRMDRISNTERERERERGRARAKESENGGLYPNWRGSRLEAAESGRRETRENFDRGGSP